MNTKGFRKHQVKYKDLLDTELQALKSKYEFKLDPTSFTGRNIYIDDNGYIYIRAKKTKRASVKPKFFKQKTLIEKYKDGRITAPLWAFKSVVLFQVIVLAILFYAYNTVLPEYSYWYKQANPIIKPTFEITKAQAETIELPEYKITIEDRVRYVFGDKADIALAIAKCESHLNPEAIGDRNLNPSSYGLFQVRAFPNRPPVADLLDAQKNIDFAYKLSKQGTDWSAWSCYTQKDTKGHNAGNYYYVKHLSN